MVLLGASNLTRGIATVLETARAILGSPVDVLAALGHGRSFGGRSWLLGRSLPGIRECGIWRALESRRESRRESRTQSRTESGTESRTKPGTASTTESGTEFGTGAATFALVTDVGNDVGYGQPVPDIIRWVGECLECLSAVEARTILTLLPVASLESLPAWKYHVARTIFFPRSRLSQAEALSRVRDLDARLRELGARTGAVLVEPEPAWYGLDPIHVRRRRWGEVWGKILGGWRPEVDPPRVRVPLLRALSLLLLRPEEWRFLGLERRRAQPAATFRDGTTVELY